MTMPTKYRICPRCWRQYREDLGVDFIKTESVCWHCRRDKRRARIAKYKSMIELGESRRNIRLQRIKDSLLEACSHYIGEER